MIKKVFNDSIHGLVELHPLLVKIIDTPEFQRLRNIKQMHGGHFVYPGATHNRFQHSIGTCYLAVTLGITEEDVLCVEIAALCHDLGHGPFSHLFDQQFLPRAWKKEGRGQHGENTLPKHEDMSIKMLDYLLDKNCLRCSMMEHKLNLPGDLIFIKDLILGKKEESGERRDKQFLFDIVSNSANGIDVDKWDYFARDCHHLGIKNNFDYSRLLLSARVCEDRKQICYRDKEMSNIYDMFRTRYMLHKRAYQHSVCAAIEEMITDAFLEADEHFQVKGSRGNMFKLSEAITDMEAYSKLTDHVFEEILYSSDPQLEQARAILRRIVTRDLYKLVGEGVQANDGDLQACKTALTERLGMEMMRDVVVKPADISYGMKRKINYKFYHKTAPDTAVALMPTASSPTNPRTFSEKLIRVYIKKSNIRDDVKAAFEEWRHEMGLVEPSVEVEEA
ncbi:deoxynucleoside triphosphate triphosphohydrolase SAMHD1-like [Synchiropus splendidus]|uniref:deoxynucleoside triphosphate triphosphohydrolase SAMHD1-like n=1 Tax=Synchiropus splendidus TaxID=270530 RepID=UPI00237DA5A5|nr:deoxynucleoside triphosphate triphosphohydrolase SAMHD1-like [Synchiropus splendidus]